MRLNLKLSQLLTAYFPVLLIDLAFSSVLTNTAFYSSYLGLSSTFLGILMAVTTGFFTVLAIPFGRLSDRIDRKYVLYAACLVMGGVSFGLPHCRNSLHLLLIFPGIGISMALFWPAYEAWLAEREGEGNLIQRVMLFNLFWSIGVTLGPAFSSYLYGDANPFRPFYLAGILVLLTLVTIYGNKFQAPHTPRSLYQTPLKHSTHPHLSEPPISMLRGVPTLFLGLCSGCCGDLPRNLPKRWGCYLRHSAT